jgi:hypothetical protein
VKGQTLASVRGLFSGYLIALTVPLITRTPIVWQWNAAAVHSMGGILLAACELAFDATDHFGGATDPV